MSISEEKQRTNLQNSCLHKYLTELSTGLNVLAIRNGRQWISLKRILIFPGA